MGPQPILPLMSTMCRPSAGSPSAFRAAALSPCSRNTRRTGMPAGRMLSRSMPQATNSSVSSSWGMTQISGVHAPTVGLQV